MSDLQPDEFAAEPPPPVEVKRQPLLTKRAVVIVVIVIAYVSLFAAGGEFLSFAFSGLEVFPFVLLAVLAYAGEERRWAKAVTMVYWAVFVCVAALVSITFVLISFGFPRIWVTDEGFTASQLGRIGFAFLGIVASFVIGAVCFLPAARSAFAALIPIDAHSFVHATALATVMTLSLLALTPLIVSGHPPILRMMKDAELMEGAGFETAPQEQVRSSLYGLIWAVPASLFAVGFPQKRKLRETCDRLGLSWPTRKQILLAATAIVLVVAVNMAVDALSTRLWHAMGWNTTDQEMFEKLFAGIGTAGAVAISLAAGVGEELVFRGVLQPRLGIVLPTLLFTAAHAHQYNFDGLLQVLLLGLSFGLIRKFSSTTVSAFVHVGYDIVVFLM